METFFAVLSTLAVIFSIIVLFVVLTWIAGIILVICCTIVDFASHIKSDSVQNGGQTYATQ